MEKAKGESCVEPAAGPVAAEPETETKGEFSSQKEEKKVSVQVGKTAPDFEANAYQADGFKTVKLSAFRGKWVMLCFYPGDFTFV